MLSIGAASRQSGVHIETIRYYEREGVLPPAERTSAGRRCYNKEGVARLRFVRQCRDLGFPIADVKALLALSGEATPCAGARTIAISNLNVVRGKIRELVAMEDSLTEIIRQCDGEPTPCPMLRPLLDTDL